MARTKRVTLEVLSKELKLSTSSVSRALRNDPLIHPETRALVNTLAVRLGYQGRSRRGPQKKPNQRTLRVLFAANSLSDIKNGFITMSYLQGMTSETEGSNIVLNVHTVAPDGTNGKSTAGDVRSILNGAGEDGVYIVIGKQDSSLVAALAKSAPVVSLVRSYEGINHDFVSTDDISGVCQLVKKLVDQGHRKLAWVSFEERSSYSRTRRAGFLEGCLSSGLDISHQELLHGVFKDGELKHPELIHHAIKKGATAFVAASDHAAYEILMLLNKEKISVPGEISLTGFDAVGEPGHHSPTFTSYDPRFVEMGRAAVRLAMWRMENLSAASLQITVKGQIVEGKTIGPATDSRGKKR